MPGHLAPSGRNIWGVPISWGYPKSSKAHFSIETPGFWGSPHFEIPPTIPENCKNSSGTQDAKSVCNSNVETRRQVFLRKPLRHQSVIEEIPEVIKTPKSAGILEIPGISAVIFRTSRLVEDPGNSNGEHPYGGFRSHMGTPKSSSTFF